MRLVLIYDGRMSQPSKPPSPAPPPAPAAQPPRWSSRVLLGGTQEAEIEHANIVYRLRLTALGKLILTK